MWWTDPNHPDVKAALDRRCGLCGAEAGVKCRTITDQPLNRPIHLFRLEP